MVAAPVCQEFQDADASRPRAERLPPRCVAGIRSLHHAADGGRSVKDALFPRRRPLGAEAAEFAALVQNRERLGGSMDEGSGDEEVNGASAGRDFYDDRRDLFHWSSGPRRRGVGAGTLPRHWLMVGEVFPLLAAGNVSSSFCRTAVAPAETCISISNTPVSDPTDGTRVARPLTSLCTVLWVALKMTGIPAWVLAGSPGVNVRLFPTG